MARNPNALRWRTEHGALYGFSGRLRVAMVLMRDDGTWVYDVLAVRTKWLAKGYGEVRSRKTAVAAVHRAWYRWLEISELTRRLDAVTTTRQP